jgi:hypothetical protein
MSLHPTNAAATDDDNNSGNVDTRTKVIQSNLLHHENDPHTLHQPENIKHKRQCQHQ